MKKLFALAIFGAGSAAAFASFTESFDTGPVGFLDGSVITWGNAAGGVDMAFSTGTWHAQNESVGGAGLTGWFNNSSAATPVFATHSGAGHLNANFNNSTGANDINNFMMSPTQTFNNGDTISFWTRTVTTPAFPDRLLLRLSLSGASTLTSDFSTTLVTVNSALSTTGFPSVYTQFTTTLTGLSGPTSGRFAFNYNVPSGGPSGANSDFIGIDDVVYTSAPVPEPATFAVLGLGAVALIRRRKKA
jgi:hypothetical protein